MIPLFPLPVVVLPGEVLPLHIFEERYKAMIADCRAARPAGEARPFWVSLARDNDLHTAGCTVRLVRTLREYDDGRLDILTVGASRFRVKEVFQDKPYLTGAVEYFDDDGEVADAELRRAAIASFEQLAEETPLEVEPAQLERAGALSFRIGAAAVSDLLEKQHLLELTNENRRLHFLLEVLTRMLDKAEGRAQARELAGSNGKLRTLKLPQG